MLILALAAVLTATTVFVAQGQITEVNPSGVGGVSVTSNGPGVRLKVEVAPNSAKGIIVDVNPSGSRGTSRAVHPPAFPTEGTTLGGSTTTSD